jgi:Ca2+-binding RTX toxin-like protein
VALNPTYNVINSAGIAQSVIDLLLGVANEAFRQWSAVLAGNANVSVRIELVETSGVGRAEGGWGNGTNIGQVDGVNLIIGGPARELQTGQNVPDNEHDILIRISRDYLLNELFLDPTPLTRNDIPGDRTDGLSVMIHEIGHALGFIGYYDTANNNQGDFATSYDLRRLDIAGEDFFRGPNVQALLGGDLELTRGNYTHYGNSNAFPGTSNDPLTGLMNGVTYYRGFAYTISDLDLAVLADTGLGTIRDDVLDNPLHTHLRGGAGNDHIIGGDIDNVFFGDSGVDYLQGFGGSDQLFGGDDNDTLDGGDGVDILIGGAGEDNLIGGANVDTTIIFGNRADFDISQPVVGGFIVRRTLIGPDTPDTGAIMEGVEFIQFDDQTIRLLPGTGVSVNFNATDPAVYQSAMNAIRDFDGNALGGNGLWLRIGQADVNGDGDIDQILVNDGIARFATVGTAPDGLTYFSDFSWAGETRVAGIYIDPLVTAGIVVAGSGNDSQRRFQNDLAIENINRVLGADDYDNDGLQEVYFALTDGTAYLRAIMEFDGNIRYANYQSQQEVIDYLTANGFGPETYAGWFTGPSNAALIMQGSIDDADANALGRASLRGEEAIMPGSIDPASFAYHAPALDDHLRAEFYG